MGTQWQVLPGVVHVPAPVVLAVCAFAYAIMCACVSDACPACVQAPPGIRLRGGGDEGYNTPPYPPSPQYSAPPSPEHDESVSESHDSLPYDLAAFLWSSSGHGPDPVGGVGPESLEPESPMSESAVASESDVAGGPMSLGRLCEVLLDLVWRRLVDMGYTYTVGQVATLIAWRMEVVEAPFDEAESYVGSIIEHVLHGALD